MKTILLDCDGVLVDCAAAVHAAAERILGCSVPHYSEWKHFEFGEAMGLTPQEAEYFFREIQLHPTLGHDIELFPGAAEFVRKLAETRDVVFVTAHWRGIEHWVSARDKLLSENFPGIDVVYTHAKHRVLGDALLDDKPENIDMNPARGWLFDQPWNRNRRDLWRVCSYAEALEVL